jgi:hypothetical protein
VRKSSFIWQSAQPRRAAHLLVQGVPLGRELSQPRAVERVEARLQPERLVHLSVPRHVPHQVEPAEPNGPVPEQILPDLPRVLGKVGSPLGVDLLRRPDLERTARGLSGLPLGLGDVDSVKKKTVERERT